MSKTKKVSDPKIQIDEMFSTLQSNLKKTIELSTEMDTILTNIFSPKKSVDQTELITIKKDFLEKSKMIDNLKEHVEKLLKENSTVTNKIGKIISKSTKADDMSKLQSEYLKNCDKISVIEKELSELNKQRTAVIKKAYLYFSKLEVKQVKNTKKGAAAKEVEKVPPKDTKQKTKGIVKTKPIQKLKEETSDSENEQSEIKKKINTLVIDEDSSDDSESETDSNISYVESGSDDESEKESESEED